MILLRSVSTVVDSLYQNTRTTNAENVGSGMLVVKESIDPKTIQKNHKCLKMVLNSFINIPS